MADLLLINWLIVMANLLANYSFANLLTNKLANLMTN